MCINVYKQMNKKGAERIKEHTKKMQYFLWEMGQGQGRRYGEKRL